MNTILLVVGWVLTWFSLWGHDGTTRYWWAASIATILLGFPVGRALAYSLYSWIERRR